MKKQARKSVAKGLKNALDVVLRIDANSASCILTYQPKLPEELKNTGDISNGKMHRSSGKMVVSK